MAAYDKGPMETHRVVDNKATKGRRNGVVAGNKKIEKQRKRKKESFWLPTSLLEFLPISSRKEINIYECVSAQPNDRVLISFSITYNLPRFGSLEMWNEWIIF